MVNEQTVKMRVYYSDPYRGRVFEEVDSIIESEGRTGSGIRYGMARYPNSGGFDWFEWPDGTLCHGRRL